MITFALDSSGKTASVCVLNNSTVLFEKTLNEGLTHSETLLALADEAFASCGLSPQKVNRYAVTCGPGSFTGLRIGLALIKGLSLPFDTPCVPVSTLMALALASTPYNGIIIPALDARRKEVYWAAFKSVDLVLERLTPDTAGPIEDAAVFARNNTPPLHLVGDGAELCYNNWGFFTEKELSYSIFPSFSIARGAALACTAFAEVCKPMPAQDLKPVYLRLSQAERERAEKLKKAVISK